MSSRLFAMFAALLALGAGCVSSEEGDALKRDITELKRQLAQNTGQAESERKKLQRVMEKATALLTRNSADVGAQVERIQTQNARLVGQIEELKQALGMMTQQLSQLKASLDVKRETTTQQNNSALNREELYQLGKQKVERGEHVAGRKLLRQFLTDSPRDKRAPLAQRLLGDSYYQEQKYTHAIVEYKKLLSGADAAEARYRIGLSFYQLKYCGDAKTFLADFVKNNRRHPHLSNAKKILRLIKRYRRNRSFCQS